MLVKVPCYRQIGGLENHTVEMVAQDPGIRGTDLGKPLSHWVGEARTLIGPHTRLYKRT